MKKDYLKIAKDNLLSRKEEIVVEEIEKLLDRINYNNESIEELKENNKKITKQIASLNKNETSGLLTGREGGYYKIKED